MCDPVTAAIVLTVATTATTAFTTIKNAKTQEAQLKLNSEIQEGQIDDAASQTANEESRRARREQARLRVAAGGSGLSLTSKSVAAQLLDSIKQSKNNQTVNQRNRNTRQTTRQAETSSLLNSVSRPSLLQAGLQIGSAGFSAGVASGAIKAKPKTK